MTKKESWKLFKNVSLAPDLASEAVHNLSARRSERR
jgi:hypothetical protein